MLHPMALRMVIFGRQRASGALIWILVAGQPGIFRMPTPGGVPTQGTPHQGTPPHRAPTTHTMAKWGPNGYPPHGRQPTSAPGVGGGGGGGFWGWGCDVRGGGRGMRGGGDCRGAGGAFDMAGAPRRQLISTRPSREPAQRRLAAGGYSDTGARRSPPAGRGRARAAPDQGAAPTIPHQRHNASSPPGPRPANLHNGRRR